MDIQTLGAALALAKKTVLPTVDSGDAGKVLAVDSSGAWGAENTTSSVIAVSGSTISIDGTDYDMVDGSAVHFTEAQSGITDAQKRQARENIGAEIASAVRVIPSTKGAVYATTSSTSVEVDADGVPVNADTSGTSSVRYAVLPCSAGDKITANVPSAVATSSRAWAFLGAVDESTTPHTRPILAKSVLNSGLTVYTAPAGTELVYFSATATQISNGSHQYYMGALTEARLDALEADATVVETVTGNNGAFTIAAEANHRYICSGTVSSISFTPCTTGQCEVVFTTGSTPVWDDQTGAVMPGWWPDTNPLEANFTYEMSFSDKRGAVMAWPT